MKLKNLTIPALILVSSILNVAHAQTVSETIPGFLAANGTVGGTRFTVNQTVTQPPGNLSISYFSFNSQPFEATTANATGHTTIWKGLLTIASNGTISGSANVECFTNTGNRSTASLTVDRTTSRIGVAQANGVVNPIATVNRANMRSESYGAYANYNSFDVIAEYPVDVFINFGSGFTARGKVVESITKSHNINDSVERDGTPSEWSDRRYILVITGPNGHAGTIIR